MIEQAVLDLFPAGSRESLNKVFSEAEVKNMTVLAEEVGKLSETAASAKTLSGQNQELQLKLTKAITPLGEKPTEKELADYRKKIGVPESIEGYESELSQTPDGKKVLEIFRAAGMPKDVAAAYLKSQKEQNIKAEEESKKDLEARIGQEFINLGENAQIIASAGAKALFDDEQTYDRVIKDPSMIPALYKIGLLVRENPQQFRSAPKAEFNGKYPMMTAEGEF